MRGELTLGQVTSDEESSDAPLRETAPVNRATEPAPLEYYSPVTDVESLRTRGLTLWSIMLLLGWLPYACGIINASTVAVSYNAAISRAHEGGAVIFLGMGLALSTISLIGFGRMRHAWGIAAAGTVLLVQAGIAACIGFAG